jgi:hypothetical protein
MYILTYFKQKNFGPYIVTFYAFGDLKVYFRNKPLKIQKNTFSNLILEFVLDFKSS